MRLPYFHVDAFTSRVFAGNPAGVCPLDRWLPDDLLQRIAAENQHAETAFFTRVEGGFHLRWLTPASEVDLCGHATLATAHVLFSELGHTDASVRFQSGSGGLTATRRGDLIELDFPSRPPAPCEAPDALLRALGRKPTAVLKARDYLAVFDSPADVAALRPDMELLCTLDCLGVIVTAPGDTSDFVSRFFAPKVGVPEDPVTGSAHCTLTPYWAEQFGRSGLFAKQISQRGGELHCRLLGERVSIGGQAVVYCRGELEVPDA